MFDEFVIICDLPGVAIEIGGGNGHGPLWRFRAFGGGGGPKNTLKVIRQLLRFYKFNIFKVKFYY